MSGKYKITSSSFILTMMVEFLDENAQSRSLSVGVDYSMNKVFFLDKSDSKIDYDYLEKQILDSMKPEDVQVPEIPTDFMYKAEQVRMGKFNNETFFDKKE
jgi:hypothetical protein